MLEPGKTYKVKVELAPGKAGYGRATVLEKQGGKTYIRLRTSKDPNYVLPVGAHLWFISDSPGSTAQGFYFALVTGTKIFTGKTAMECGPLKFEPVTSRRRSKRVPLVCPATLAGQALSYPVRSCNISRSGIGLEAFSQYVDEFPVGGQVEIVLATPSGEVLITCSVIRTEYDWLSNRTVIGLQFVSMSQEAVYLLEKLRAGSASPDENTSGFDTTLSGSLRTTRDNFHLTDPGHGRHSGAKHMVDLDIAEAEDF